MKTLTSFLLIFSAASAFGETGVARAAVGHAAERLDFRYRVTTAETRETRHISEPWVDDPAAAPESPFAFEPFVTEPKRIHLVADAELTPAAQFGAWRLAYENSLYRPTFGVVSQLLGYATDPKTIFGGWHPGEAETRRIQRENQSAADARQMWNWAALSRFGSAAEAREIRNLAIRYQQTRLDGFFTRDGLR